MSLIERMLRSLRPGKPALEADSAAAAAMQLIASGQDEEKMGRIAEARSLYMKAVETSPGLSKAHMNLGNAHLATGDTEQATRCYLTAIDLDPNSAPAHYNLGNAHWHLQDDKAALQCYLKASDLDPKFGLPWIAIANILAGMGKVDEAIEACQHAISIDRDDAEAHFVLGMIYRTNGRLDKCIESLRTAVALRPHHQHALPTLADVLASAFRFKEAQDCVRRAIQLAPNAIQFRTALLFLLSEDETVTPDELFREHVAAGQQIEHLEASHRIQHERSNEPERTLRIGFISGDFNNHPVSYFTTPIFRCLAKRTDITLYAYHNSHIDDEITQTIRPLFQHWRLAGLLNNDDLTSLIRNDGIDILIDLSGHTKANRLGVLARKPAPIQASWIGYAGTTGMRSIDYFLADRQLLPKNIFESQFVEKLVHLPAVGAFQPLDASVSVNELPSLASSHFTFASFNRVSKINRRNVAAWAAILRKAPNARMLVASITDVHQIVSLKQWFKEEGVEESRLIFEHRCGFDAYMKLHHGVDLCLDTSPYSGGTTTLYAMWMGVPTLTLVGKTPVGRQTGWSLEHVGLGAFITHSLDEFVQQGCGWANRRAELAEIRASLRERLELSDIGNPGLISNGIANALRMMWRRWCADLPAAFIDASQPESP